MNLFQMLIAAVVAALPLPAFSDRAAVYNWLLKQNDPLADLISALVQQFRATGQVLIDLPNGSVVSIVEGPDGLPCMTNYQQEMLCAAVPEAIPGKDGTWLAILQQLLPWLLKILPFFLANQDDKVEPIVV